MGQNVLELQGILCISHSTFIWTHLYLPWVQRRALLDHLQFTLIRGPNIPGSYAILFFTASDFTYITRYIHNWESFLLWPSCFILSGVTVLRSSPVAYWAPSVLWSSLSVSCLFAFSYCSWGSLGKNTEAVCHSLLQWTIFCQNSPSWPIRLGWLYMAWLIVSLS